MLYFEAAIVSALFSNYCKYKIVYFKFRFTLRTQLIDKLPQSITLDEPDTSITNLSLLERTTSVHTYITYYRYLLIYIFANLLGVINFNRQQTEQSKVLILTLIGLTVLFVCL